MGTPATAAGVINVAGNASVALDAAATVNGFALNPGDFVRVLQVPEGTILSDVGSVTLPAGSMVLIPARPELGAVFLDTALSGEINGIGAMALDASDDASATLTLDYTVTLNGVELNPGDVLGVLQVPDGVTLPDVGSMTLPAGTVVTILSRPDLGALALDTAVSGELNAGPDASAEVAGVQVIGPRVGVPSLPNRGAIGVPGVSFNLSQDMTVMATLELTSNAMLGDTLLPAGERLDVMGVPQSIGLPEAGSVTLPPGSMVAIPGRSDLGVITTDAPITGILQTQ